MKYLFLLSCSLVVAAPAWAQGDPLCPHSDDVVTTDCPPRQVKEQDFPTPVRTITAEDIFIDDSHNKDSIVVVATGMRTELKQLGQSISVVTPDELDSVQGPDLTRALERLPGVSLARSGGLGSQTSLFVRGANSEQLLVTIDGIRVEDTAAPSGGFDLGTLMSGGIGRVELLRGSNSLAWGSDAIGGVLALSTDTRPAARASLEYGANNLFDANAGLGLEGKSYSLGLAGGYTRTDGISAFAGGAEADPFRQWHLGGRGSFNVTDSVKLVAAGRYADSRIDFDGYPAPTYSVFADTPEYQTTRQGSGRVGLEYWSYTLKLGAGVAMSDTRRAYFDPTYGSTASNFETAGRSVHADLTGRADLAEQWSLDFGGDADWSRFSTTFDPRQTARIVGAHALLGYHGERLNLTAGGRIDDHDRFGSHTTLGPTAASRLMTTGGSRPHGGRVSRPRRSISSMATAATPRSSPRPARPLTPGWNMASAMARGTLQ